MVMFMNNKFLNEIIKLAEKAEKNNCVPVGAIVVKDNKIISKGYNKKEKTNNPMDHAEIIAIKKASKKIKNWRMPDCEIYVTMKPCAMCQKVIAESRIMKVHYLIDNKKQSSTTNNILNKINMQKENERIYEINYTKIITNFFKKRR